MTWYGVDPMDWTRIEELRDEVGDEALEEILEVFISEIDDFIDTLNARDSVASLAGDLHFLRGAALNIGFQALAEACQSGESMAKAGQGADVDLTAIVARYGECRAELATRHAIH